MGIIQKIIEGLVSYVIADYAMDALITGTSSGELIMTTLVPIGIAAGVVIASLGLKWGQNQP